jgi:hypothetical protein
MSKPKSFIASNEPLATSRVDSGYFRDADDLRVLIAGVRHMREVVSQPAFQGIAADELSQRFSQQTDNQIENASDSVLGPLQLPPED